MRKIHSRKIRTGDDWLIFMLSFFASLMLLSFIIPSSAATGPTMPCGPTGSPNHSSSTVNPNCGGGGGGGCGNSNEIVGIVYNAETWAGVPNINVMLADSYGQYYLLSTYTDANGYFALQSSSIAPNTYYLLQVNGITVATLGKTVRDSGWGQWMGGLQTDSCGYYYMSGRVAVEPVHQVEVPFAALYSNTQYGQAIYTYGTTTGFSHTLDFSIDSSVGGIGVGYMQETSGSTSYSYGVIHNNQQYVAADAIALTYYCGGMTAPGRWSCGSTGIASSGIYQITQPAGTFRFLQTSEYLSPQGVQQQLPSNTLWGRSYTETGSYTWNFQGGPGFSISYMGFGINIKLDTTVSVTQGQTTGVSFQVTNDSSNTLTFEAFTAGQPYNQDAKTGGMEVHIWCISQTGCS